jgi:replicative DNA helicase
MSDLNGNGHSNGVASPLRWMDRLPPQNLEVELGVLGMAMLDSSTLGDVAERVGVADFYRDTHQLIYKAIIDLHAEGKPVDFTTVANELVRRNQFDRVGGNEMLLRLAEGAPVSANAAYYADIIREKSVKRTIIEAANQLLRDGYSEEFTAAEALQRAERTIFDLSMHQTATGNVRSVAEILPVVLETIRRRRGGEVSGISSGFPDLDFITGGFQPGQLVVLAARPSHGKSALAWAFAEHAAVAVGTPSLFASLEMTSESLIERALSSRSRIDGHKIRTGYALLANDLAKLDGAVAELSPAPIFVDDTPAQTMLHAMSTARRLKLRHGLGLVVFDYAQLAESGDGSVESRQEQVAAISRRLKAMARELGVPVVALSQLNRECEKRPDHQPILADLRESGAIEQDADIVILLNRPERYDPNDQPGIAIVDVAKNRNGATGRVKLYFQRAFVRFDSLARMVEPGDAAAF